MPELFPDIPNGNGAAFQNEPFWDATGAIGCIENKKYICY
jgi:hypothetical protein